MIQPINPMLAQSSTKPFDSPDHIFETKYDGVRAIVYLPDDTVLDGETCCLNPQGVSDFNVIQQRMNLQDPMKIKFRATSIPAKFFAFDVLYHKGENIMGKPLSYRKTVLNSLPTMMSGFHIINRAGNDVTTRYPEISSFEHSPFIPQTGIFCFSEAERLHMEGVMAKDLRSPYQPGKRSPYWIKLKCWQAGEFLVGGYTEGKGKQEGLVGNLILWEDLPTGPKPVGEVGTGWDYATLETLTKALSHIIVPNPTLPSPPKQQNGDTIRWLLPLVYVNIKYLERGGAKKDGKLRFPVYQGISRVKEVK